MDQTSFQEANNQYIQDGLTTRRSGEHTTGMLKEILQEVDMGRIEGPFRAPAHWCRQTVPVKHRPDLPLLDCPVDFPLASYVFPIMQTGSDGSDKVRRGEDWRRSKHNSTVKVTDQPHHHNIDSYVNAGRRAKQLFPDHDVHIWGHDHEGAYRQLPCRNPDHAYMIIMTEDGPTLWRHNVLLFGAVGSVWGYNRFSDALMNICRSLFGVPVIHYVDDFGSSEPAFSAPTSFWTFSLINDLFGLRTKPSKEQGPGPEHKIQGAFINFAPSNIIVAPTPNRVIKLDIMINKALDTNTLTPDDAGTLAGKAQHYSTTTFGKVARAPLKPIYARQHAVPTPGSHTINTKLTHGLRSALETLQFVIHNTGPRTLYYDFDTRPTALVYADAFFEIGDQKFHPSRVPDDLVWNRTIAKESRNGWGTVIFPVLHSTATTDVQKAIAFRGTVPVETVLAFGSRRAYLYFLEAFAQVISSIIFSDLLGQEHMTFCDNEAAKHALIRGYGTDTNINNMIAMFWTHAAQSQSQPWIDRVCSSANLSDGVSRDEWDLCEQMGWARLDLNFDQVYVILQSVATDSAFAYNSAAAQIREIMQDQIQDKMKLIPWAIDIVYRTSPERGQRTRGTEPLSATSVACGRGGTVTPP
jgi:hypothetical protein